MLATESYELWYNGESEHRILGLAKYDFNSPQSKQLAEYFLDKLDYAGHAQSATAHLMRYQTLEAHMNPAASYVKHIHRDKKEEIESRWHVPQLTDEEAAEILFEDKLEKELEKIKTKHDVIINCGQ